MSVGFDCGTYNLVTARRGDSPEEVKVKREVNAFLKIPLEDRFTFNMLKKSGVKLYEQKKFAYVLGEGAVKMAYTFGKDLARPMKDGTLNPEESESFEILKVMIHSLIGEIKGPKETVYYCVPADAVNAATNAAYHKKIIEQIFLAYNINGKKIEAFSINEALALIYAELADRFFTGIGISCLVPGTKIYTRSGIKNIEDVESGDEVITHKGCWKRVDAKIKNPFSGKGVRLRVRGAKNFTYEFVKNHEVYVNRNGEWKWIGCDDVVVGDVVAEPIIKHDRSKPKPFLNYSDRITSSSKRIKKRVESSGNLHRLIGYFLADGHVDAKNRCFCFDFGPEETKYVKDVQEIVLRIFGKSSTVYPHGNANRVKVYSKSLAIWFRKRCYDDQGNKKQPWCLSQLNKSDCLNLLAGLVRGDGWINEGINFGNSNSSLVMLAKQLFSRLGFAASIWSRIGHVSEIKGRKITSGTEWIVQCGQNMATTSLKDIIDNITCRDKYISSSVIDGDFCTSVVTDVEEIHYEGDVYDLQVEDDHSFSGPNLTIHNCGSGMVNACVSVFSQAAAQFSIVGSGDWIDSQVAKATNTPAVVVNQEKMKFDLLAPQTSPLERALHASYRILVENTISQIKSALVKANLKVKVEDPFNIVLGGGVASPNGFEELVREAIKDADFPIPVGEIIKPKDHLYAVARGCLCAAEQAN